MRMPSVATLVTILTLTAAGCSESRSIEPEPGDSEPATSTTSEPDSSADDNLRSLQERLGEQGIDEGLATFGLEWCRHQDVAMLAREVGGMDLAERVAAAASESAC